MMLKDTESERRREEATLPQDPPRKRWTCGRGQGKMTCLRIINFNGKLSISRWSYDPSDWCDPVEFK